MGRRPERHFEQRSSRNDDRSGLRTALDPDHPNPRRTRRHRGRDEPSSHVFGHGAGDVGRTKSFEKSKTSQIRRRRF